MQTRARFERLVRRLASRRAPGSRPSGGDRVAPGGRGRTCSLWGQRGSPGRGHPGFRECFWKASVPRTENESRC